MSRCKDVEEGMKDDMKKTAKEVLVAFISVLGILGGFSVHAEQSGTADLAHRRETRRTAVTDQPRRWAGFQRVVGYKDLVFLGKVDTQTDSFLLADVQEEDGRLVLTQRTCRVNIAEVAGVQASIEDRAAQRLPQVVIEFEKAVGGSFKPASWVSRWGQNDDDGDGEAGVTIEVDAPLCGGSLRVASTTTTEAQARRVADAIEASVDVTVEQSILETSNFCLDLTASDTVEQVHGKVLYVPVPSSATCASLLGRGWPVTPPSAK